MDMMKKEYAEEVTVAKKNFKGTVAVPKKPNAINDCDYLTFKAWKNDDKKRIYINDYKGRTVGYIENAKVSIKDYQGNFKEEIDYALNSFMEQYDFARDFAKENNGVKKSNEAKKTFKGTVKIAKKPDAVDEYHYLTFKAWQKDDKKRIYINDYKGRTIGYIENAKESIKDYQGNSKEEIDYALNSFKEQYNY